MKNRYYYVCDKQKKSVAIFNDINQAVLFRCDNRKKFQKSIPIYNSLPKLDQWFQIEQPKGKLVGYFSKRDDASKFLKEEFYCARIID